ncbi:ribulose kinase [Paramixta manurensis]|uniref:Ribulose kinase n=1 Tax=Paramixta manurensis TaxID=2740817 RepID=A0A6M8UHQ9_9GAMM|nr:ribulose kinase [Erwiniaceae bacterium PD-1]
MTSLFIIGLDYGSESARGVLIDTVTGEQVDSCTHTYRHGIMTDSLPTGRPLPAGWALQDAADYLEAAQIILEKLGNNRHIASIGVGFTASSPLPASADGQALSTHHPDEPHAYVKLWKHSAPQAYVDEINRRGDHFLDNFGGKVSGEWLLAKAAQLADEAPHIWAQADRFIEAGDWLVWQLTQREVRSLDFAAYKAQYTGQTGYPHHLVDGLEQRLTTPYPVGTAAGTLSNAWRQRTGILGNATVAVAVIDSHVVLPAVGTMVPHTLVAALGTSAAYLFLDDTAQPLPTGIEGMANGAALPDVWCYEAGQAGFGDILAWFVRTFPRSDDMAESFRLYNSSAAALAPAQTRLLALDWWSGNRVPFADAHLSGLLVGLTLTSTSTDIYRALLEALCFGARAILDYLQAGGVSVQHILLTSGLSQRNPLLMQMMADVLGHAIKVPNIQNPTAVGAAIHGAVAAGIVADFATGSRRFGARDFECYQPRDANTQAYQPVYQQYRELMADNAIRRTMHHLADNLRRPQ